MQLRTASGPSDTELIARLAMTCWRSHYTPIIGAAQVDYMLETFQSPAAIATQVAAGRRYLIIASGDDTPCGYLAYDESPDSLFLSKLYILPEHQRSGLGQWAIDELTKRHPGSSIQLTVNKHNHSAIRFYEKNGFQKLGPVVADIGNGFVMDDWKMEKTPSSYRK